MHRLIYLVFIIFVIQPGLCSDAYPEDFIDQQDNNFDTDNNSLLLLTTTTTTEQSLVQLLVDDEDVIDNVTTTITTTTTAIVEEKQVKPYVTEVEYFEKEKVIYVLSIFFSSIY